MKHKEDNTNYLFALMGILALIALYIWAISDASGRTYNLKEDCNYEDVPQRQIHEKIVSCIERMNKDVQELRTNSGTLAKLVKQEDYLPQERQ